MRDFNPQKIQRLIHETNFDVWSTAVSIKFNYILGGKDLKNISTNELFEEDLQYLALISININVTKINMIAISRDMTSKI